MNNEEPQKKRNPVWTAIKIVVSLKLLKWGLILILVAFIALVLSVIGWWAYENIQDLIGLTTV